MCMRPLVSVQTGRPLSAVGVLAAVDHWNLPASLHGAATHIETVRYYSMVEPHTNTNNQHIKHLSITRKHEWQIISKKIAWIYMKDEFCLLYSSMAMATGSWTVCYTAAWRWSLEAEQFATQLHGNGHWTVCYTAAWQWPLAAEHFATQLHGQ